MRGRSDPSASGGAGKIADQYEFLECRSGAPVHGFLKAPNREKPNTDRNFSQIAMRTTPRRGTFNFAMAFRHRQGFSVSNKICDGQRREDRAPSSSTSSAVSPCVAHAVAEIRERHDITAGFPIGLRKRLNRFPCAAPTSSEHLQIEVFQDRLQRSCLDLL